MTPIQLLVVDDHNLFRRGLIALLSLDTRFRVCGEAADIGEALRRIENECPDLILLDNHLPGVRGVDGMVEAIRAARAGNVDGFARRARIGRLHRAAIERQAENLRRGRQQRPARAFQPTGQLILQRIAFAAVFAAQIDD